MKKPAAHAGAPVIHDLFEPAPPAAALDARSILAAERPSQVSGADAWRADPVAAFESMLRSITQANGRGYSANSIKVYLSMWRKFCRYCEGEDQNGEHAARAAVPVIKVTTSDILRFLGSLVPKRAGTGPDGRPVAASASIRSRYVVVLEMAYGRMKRLGLRLDNPALSVPAETRYVAPRDQRPPVNLSADEEDEISRAGGDIPRDEGNWRGARDYAVQQLILGSGVRVSEVRILGMNDLEFGVLGAAAGPRAGEACLHLIIVPNGARRKPRRIPVATFAIQPLQDWLRLRAMLAPATSSQLQRDLVFPSTEDGEPLAACTIYRHIAAAMRRADLEKRHLGPQVLRHTFATRQLRKEVKLATVSAWLGHELVSSTLVYRTLATAGEPGEVK